MACCCYVRLWIFKDYAMFPSSVMQAWWGFTTSRCPCTMAGRVWARWEGIYHLMVLVHFVGQFGSRYMWTYSNCSFHAVSEIISNSIPVKLNVHLFQTALHLRFWKESVLYMHIWGANDKIYLRGEVCSANHISMKLCWHNHNVKEKNNCWRQLIRMHNLNIHTWFNFI